MNRLWPFAVVLVLVANSVITADDQETTRNPFGVKDVSDLNGEELNAFAAKVKLAGDDKDANAAWAPGATAGMVACLDGEWSSRWNRGVAGNEWIYGTAKVKVIGDRVYILYKDETSNYLIDARRDGTRRLVGRYVDLRSGEGTPWVGVVVNDERIDGEWTMGRWDLRRTIADK